MKKLFLSVFAVLAITGAAFAQVTPDPGLTPAQGTTPPPAKKKRGIIRSIHDFTDSVKYDKLLAKDSIKCAPDFPKVKADDVVYSKRVWRDVFFVETANRYLSAAEPNKNIARILLDEIRSGKIDGFTEDGFNNLNDSANIDNTLNTLGIVSDEEFSDYEKNTRFGLRLMEDWYFDKNRSEFKAFIVGIALLVPNSINIGGAAAPDPTAGGTAAFEMPKENLGALLNNMQPVFWVNYPSIRERLCKYTVAHPNDYIKYSFDDVLQLRYFSSMITKESTPEGIRIKDRKDLLTGLDKLLEADRIKKSLQEYEQDMWEY